MSEQLIQAVEQWIQYDPNPTSKAAVEKLYADKDFDTLSAHFLPRIAFGTAGLRSKMTFGYKNMNELVVLQATQGLCAAVLEKFPTDAKTRGVVIGYDGRYNSKTFAEIAANVFLSKDIKVYLYPYIVGTPLVPYAVTNKKACAGLMITASHNPKQDNGYKVYWDNGVQIIPPTDAFIAQHFLNNLTPWTSPIPVTLDQTKPELLASVECMETIIDEYYKSIVEQSCLSPEMNKTATVKATYTAMHGVGARYTARALKEFGLPEYIPTVEQVQPDPDFPTVDFPNPEEGRGALALAIQHAEASGSTIILANDPDADRLAVAAKHPETQQWIILTGNEIATLFADYNYHKWCEKHADLSPEALKEAKSKLLVVASTVSSKQLQSMAQIEGFQFRDTLTGFKWIGNEAKKAVETEGCTILVSYEVEIGFIVGHTSFDKDGIRCAAQMYELTNYWQNTTNHTLFDRLEVFAKKYGYFSMANSYFFAEPAQVNEIAAKLRDYTGTGSYPSACRTYPITSTRDITLGKDTKYENGLSVLPVQDDAQMLTFTFANGATCTLRNSGTEPKLKYYVEVVDYESKEKANKLLDEMRRFIVNDFIKPSLYGLVHKKGDDVCFDEPTQ